MRHKPLGVCSGTFHSKSQPQKSTFPQALTAGGTRVVMKCCRLVDISCNNNLPTSAYLYLQFKSPVGWLMTAALRKSPGVAIAEINSKHNRLKKSISSNPLWGKKKKEKMATGQTIQHLIITGGMTTKTITRNQIPPVRMDTLKGRQRVNVGDGQLMIEPHYMVGGNGRCQQPLEKAASACQKINLSRELSLVSDIHTWAYSPRNPSFKKTHAPQHSLLYYL